MANPIMCTIIAKNYISCARVLCESFLRVHPTGTCYVLIIDEYRGYINPQDEPFQIVTLDELHIPNLKSFCFQYNVLELATATKPYLLEYLLENKESGRLLYLDPDILVTNSLHRLYGLLDSSDILLTPHLDRDYPDDGLRPATQNILLAGIYNLGFIGVKDCLNTRSFLEWWKRKLYNKCIDAPEKGYFVDQRYLDLAVLLFKNIRSVSEPGYNVGWWNLHGNNIMWSKDGWQCNDSPLYFYHFSNYSPQHPELICKRQNRFSLIDMPDLARLFSEYRTQLLNRGFELSVKWPYGFGFFKTGVRIDQSIRKYYRENPERWVDYGDPFQSRTLENVPYRSRKFVTAYLNWIRSRLQVRTRFMKLVSHTP